MSRSPSDKYPTYKPRRASSVTPQPPYVGGAYGIGHYGIPQANAYYSTSMTVGSHVSYTPYEPLGPVARPGYPPHRPSYPIACGYSSASSYSPASTTPLTFPGAYDRETRGAQESSSAWERIKSTITRRNSRSSPKYAARERDTEPANGVFIPPPLDPIDPHDPPRRNDVHPLLRPQPLRNRTQSTESRNAPYGQSGRIAMPMPQHPRTASYAQEPRPQSASRNPYRSRDTSRDRRQSASVEPDTLRADGYTAGTERRMRTNSNASRLSHNSRISHTSQGGSRPVSRSTSTEPRNKTPDPRPVSSSAAPPTGVLRGILRKPKPTEQLQLKREDSQSRSRRPPPEPSFPPIDPPSPSHPTTLVRLSSRPRLRPVKSSARDAPQIHKFLSKGSLSLVRFDLRLPATSVKKLVSGSNFTHLNHDDNWDAAVCPARKHVRIYCDLCPDTCIDVSPNKRPSGNTPAPSAGYGVTVVDVLKAVARMFNSQIDREKFTLDSVDPEIHDRLTRALRRRMSMLKSRSTEDEALAKERGLCMVDYLGSRCIFAGLTVAYDENMTTWLVLETRRESS